MRLSVVIPYLNEINALPEVLAAVQAAPGPEKEIIIADDGSTDGTQDYPNCWPT